MCMEKPGRAWFGDALLSWGVPHPCAHVLVPGSRAPQGCFACVNHSSGAEESGGSSGASRRVLIAAPLRCFQNPFVPLTRITIHFYLPTPHWDALKVPLLFPPPPHTHSPYPCPHSERRPLGELHGLRPVLGGERLHHLPPPALPAHLEGRHPPVRGVRPHLPPRLLRRAGSGGQQMHKYVV